jgi:hypothetical protein
MLSLKILRRKGARRDPLTREEWEQLLAPLDPEERAKFWADIDEHLAARSE